MGLLLALSSHVYAPQRAAADTWDVFSSWQFVISDRLSEAYAEKCMKGLHWRLRYWEGLKSG